MLVGRDLGLPNLVVLVLVFGVFPAIGFVIRRKWRHAVARKEEIKRLLVLASEEAARAEIEASEGYFYTVKTSSSGPLPDSAWVSAPDSAWVAPTASVPLVSSIKPPYQCAVCFSPTSTRCAKCKAVHYCSGRCQIVHWRQGHKDDCHPYVAVKPVKDVPDSSIQQGHDENSHEVLHQKDDTGVQSHTQQPETNSVFQSTSESSSEEYSTFSTPSRSSESSSGSSGDSDRMDAHPLADVISDHSVTVKSKHQTLASPARKSTSSGNANQKKSHFNVEDMLPDDGSNKPIDPSATSSGFWSGTTHSKKSTIDEIDGFEPSSSKDTVKLNIDSQPSLGLSSKVTKNGCINTGVKGVTVTPVISDDSIPNGLGSKKSNVETSSSNEMLIDGLKSTRPPKYSSEMLEHKDLPQPMLKDPKLSPSGAGEHSTLKDSKMFEGLPFAIPERSSHVFNNSNIMPPASKSTRVDSSSSKAPDIRVTSSISRVASQSAKPVTVNVEKHTVATCSSKATENLVSSKNGLKTSMLKVADQLKPSKLSRHCSPRAEIDTAHKYSCKGLFSYEMFVKLYNWKQVELQPFGLINCGNSCYANAVLQCLTYTPPLNAYLLEGLHSKACDKRDWCFTCEFESLILKAKNGNSLLSPIRILSRIENIGSNLGPGREEDAHEFLRYAIDTLQSVCLKEAKIQASNSLEEETTLIGLTFGGYLRSKIKCMKCGGKSERHDRMMDLTVEIEGNIGTLEEALDKFTSTEILDGENKYKCSRCKSYEKAKKKLTLLEAPNVLTIALKRFQSGKFGKLNKSIHFPEILDMAPYVSGTSDKSPVYRLYGVVVHVDTMNAAYSGHYVCYVKNVQNRWFKFDDCVVQEVDLRHVLKQGAYMLLYARCSPRAPRSIRNSLIQQHDPPRKHKMPTPRPHCTEPWDGCNFHPLNIRYRSLEEESSSSSDNSGFFSDGTHRDDHVSDDYSRNMNMMNSSDSDTSSSSSFPSPLPSRLSRLYSSRVNGVVPKR